MGTPDHLTSLLRNLYAGQGAIIRTRHRTMYWFKIGKGVHRSYVLSPSLFDLHAKYIKQNPRLDESQGELRLLGEISTTSDMQMTPLYGRK